MGEIYYHLNERFCSEKMEKFMQPDLTKRQKYFRRNEIIGVLALSLSLPILFLSFILFEFFVCYFREIPFPAYRIKDVAIISILWVFIWVIILKLSKKSR